MHPHELFRFYTEKMEEARKAAADTQDEFLIDRWLSIAEGYRVLALGHRPAQKRRSEPK
jgi:hypothetical protein